MTLADVKKVVDTFSHEELRQLREYIVEREEQVETQESTMGVEALLKALEDIREGVTEEEFAEIERAMNEEYIEPLDADE